MDAGATQKAVDTGATQKAVDTGATQKAWDALAWDDLINPGGPFFQAG